MTRDFRTAGLMGASTLVLTLAACKLDNQPLFGRGEPRAESLAATPPLGPLDPASDVVALPPAQAYAYPERAYAVSRTAYARPPSYAFAYGDEQPYAWDVADEGLVFAEPYDDDWRYYYYEPGEAYPYYVQDDDYGYAYGDDGVLLALFTAAGALIAADRYDDYAPRAGYYWTRGYDLNRTYWRAPRRPVEERLWRTQAPVIFQSRDRWSRAFAAQPGWREAQRHDNGRRLGWDKMRGEPNGGRPAALSAPPQRLEARHAAAPPRGRTDRPEDRGWREAHGPAFREARQDHRQGGPQPAAREARAQARGHGDRGGGAWREARREPGPQQHEARGPQVRGPQAHGPQAHAAGSQGHDAGWRAPDRPQAQHGGGRGPGGGHEAGARGGGGHGDGGHGGGGKGGGGKGNGHEGKGGGKDR